MSHRIDANEPEIVKALRDVGGEWIPLHGDPMIAMDGLALFRSGVWLCEIKDAAQPPSKRRLTPREERRKKQVERHGVAYNVIESTDAMLRLIGAIK